MRRFLGVVLAAAVTAAAGCQAGPGTPMPPIVAGASDSPREVNLIARDYAFVPDVVELVPGETVLLHVVNGGLVVHEAIIGDATVQDAWEAAEAATVGAPPGPTPVGQRAAGPGGDPDRGRLGRAGRPGLDRAGRRRRSGRRRRPSGPRLAGRLPHPGPLGKGHAGPHPLGRPGQRRHPVDGSTMRAAIGGPSGTLSPCVTQDAWRAEPRGESG